VRPGAVSAGPGDAGGCRRRTALGDGFQRGISAASVEIDTRSDERARRHRLIVVCREHEGRITSDRSGLMVRAKLEHALEQVDDLRIRCITVRRACDPGEQGVALSIASLEVGPSVEQQVHGVAVVAFEGAQ